MKSFLVWMTLSRLFSGSAFMAWAAAVPFIMRSWGLSAAEAGLVQTVFNLAYAVSLLASAWMADRHGARLIFGLSNWLSAIAFIACALFASSLVSATVLFGLLALCLGGAYAPSLMLASAAPEEQRGSAVGWTLAGASLGYFGVIAASGWLIPAMGLELTWLALAMAPIGAAVFGTLSTRALGEAGRPAATAETGSTSRPTLKEAMSSRWSVLLTAGYAAHCWELLGMWAWAPAFLAMALSSYGIGPVAVGLMSAAALHLSGAASTVLGGLASDRFGRKRVLIVLALAGAVCSFAFGWLEPFGAVVLVAAAALYGFSVLGDSGVLSAAMADSAPPALLGRMLALRSIVGFGAGALAPVTFGLVLDLTNSSGSEMETWGWAFSLLGLGGLGAAACAALLPDKASGQAVEGLKS